MPMKFMVSWTTRPGGSATENEEAVRRGLQLFSKWSPKEGQNFLAFVSRCDGNGGYALVETDDPVGLLDGPSKFGTLFEFQVTPVVDITEGTPVATEAMEWRDSIS